MEQLVRIDHIRERIYSYLGTDDLIRLSWTCRFAKHTVQAFPSYEKIILQDDNPQSVYQSKFYLKAQDGSYTFRGPRIVRLEARFSLKGQSRLWTDTIALLNQLTAQLTHVSLVINLGRGSVEESRSWRFKPACEGLEDDSSNRIQKRSLLDELLVQLNHFPRCTSLELDIRLAESNKLNPLNLSSSIILDKFPHITSLSLIGDFLPALATLPNPSLLTHLEIHANRWTPWYKAMNGGLSNPTLHLNSAIDMELTSDTALQPDNPLLHPPSDWLGCNPSSLESLSLSIDDTREFQWSVNLLNLLADRCPQTWHHLTINFKFDGCVLAYFGQTLTCGAQWTQPSKLWPLTNLTLTVTDDHLLTALLGRCPSLESLDFYIEPFRAPHQSNGSTTSGTLQINYSRELYALKRLTIRGTPYGTFLRRFLARCPNLESLTFAFSSANLYESTEDSLETFMDLDSDPGLVDFCPSLVLSLREIHFVPDEMSGGYGLLFDNIASMVCGLASLEHIKIGPVTERLPQLGREFSDLITGNGLNSLRSISIYANRDGDQKIQDFITKPPSRRTTNWRLIGNKEILFTL